MKRILGLILELNPFHNGHNYFIRKAQEIVNPDITIAIITTNFSMRGDIHTIDKFTKTKLLLKSNIDLVVELPFLGSVCSADYFAYNAIKTLSEFKITDLAFGSECQNIDELYRLKDLLNNKEYNYCLKTYLDKGYSYSTATVKTIQELTNDLDLATKFSLPNNTLAIQYLNALEKIDNNIKVTLITRKDNNYYDENLTSSFNSATSLRLLLKEKKNISEYTPEVAKDIHYIDLNKSQDNLYKLLQYQLLTTDILEIKNYLGVNEGIENRFISFLKEKNYDDFLKNMETKRYTKLHIKRLMLYLVFRVPQSFSPQYHHYLRVLGMNQLGKKYLSTLDKDTKKQIITSFKNATDDNSQFELLATKIYGIITNQNDLYLNEYKVPIIGE